MKLLLRDSTKMLLAMTISALAGLASLVAPPRNPHAVLEIGGTRYDSWVQKQLIKQVNVELTTDQASEATLTFFDPRFEFIDRYTSGDGVPWLVCRVWLGFGRKLGEPLFKGLLARVERSDTDTVMRVYDMGYKLRQEKKAEYHNNRHDLEIIEKLARRNGLGFQGPDKSVQLERHKAMVQDAKNDWEHARERARDSGLVIYVRHDTLFAKEPATIGSPRITLINRKDFLVLHSFDLSYKVPENQQGRPKRVERRGRSSGGKRLTGESREHQRGTRSVEITRDLAIHSKPFAKRRAHSSKELQREHAFICTIRSIAPLPRTRPDVRDRVRLVNLGKLFSGLYLCDKVTHSLGQDGMHTEYSLYRDID